MELGYLNPGRLVSCFLKMGSSALVSRMAFTPGIYGIECRLCIIVIRNVFWFSSFYTYVEFNYPAPDHTTQMNRLCESHPDNKTCYFLPVSKLSLLYPNHFSIRFPIASNMTSSTIRSGWGLWKTILPCPNQGELASGSNWTADPPAL